MVGEWELTQKDAESLGDELKEDKWLTVFRTVSSQAEDMMVRLPFPWMLVMVRLELTNEADIVRESSETISCLKTSYHLFLVVQKLTDFYSTGIHLGTTT